MFRSLGCPAAVSLFFCSDYWDVWRLSAFLTVLIVWWLSAFSLCSAGGCHLFFPFRLLGFLIADSLLSVQTTGISGFSSQLSLLNCVVAVNISLDQISGLPDSWLHLFLFISFDSLVTGGCQALFPFLLLACWVAFSLSFCSFYLLVKVAVSLPICLVVFILSLLCSIISN